MTFGLINNNTYGGVALITGYSGIYTLMSGDKFGLIIQNSLYTTKKVINNN